VVLAAQRVRGAEGTSACVAAMVVWCLHERQECTAKMRRKVWCRRTVRTRSTQRQRQNSGTSTASQPSARQHWVFLVPPNDITGWGKRATRRGSANVESVRYVHVGICRVGREVKCRPGKARHVAWVTVRVNARARRVCLHVCLSRRSRRASPAEEWALCSVFQPPTGPFNACAACRKVRCRHGRCAAHG